MWKKLFILILLSFFITAKTEAKVLPQAQKFVSKTPAKAVTNGIGVYPKLRSDRKAVIINFTNLQNATNVSYFLSYKTSIQEEGAMGALNLKSGSTQTQELLFGTCSKNVCTYHWGINDAKLDISYTLKSGKKYLKKYKIKV